MPGTSIGEAEPITRNSMVQQCRSVLNAGGTVYLGERHDQKHAREICKDLIRARCIQFLCVEYDHDATTGAETTEDLMALMVAADKMTTVTTGRAVAEITMPDVAQAATADPDCRIVFIDKTTKQVGQRWVDTPSDERQRHMRDTVAACRAGVNKPGRGVLVVVGADHLTTIPSGQFAWDALHEIVYGGLSFRHGRYQSCIMIWQLS